MTVEWKDISVFLAGVAVSGVASYFIVLKDIHRLDLADFEIRNDANKIKSDISREIKDLSEITITTARASEIIKGLIAPVDKDPFAFPIKPCKKDAECSNWSGLYQYIRENESDRNIFVTG